jgi:tetratricopeptide (TPR) repeat protein
MIRFSWLASILVRQAIVLAYLLVLAAAPATSLAQAPLNRQQALNALGDVDPSMRMLGMVRLADIGTAADADALLPRLADPDPTVRRIALPAIWRLWGRSGDATIDALYETGIGLMQSGDLPKAVLVFSDIIGKHPMFAEAWNKRATIYYLMNEYELSMKDCDEVLKRIPKHFGALSGYSQMLAERGQPERALEYLERAFSVNPNMGNAELMIQDLRRQVNAKQKKST